MIGLVVFVLASVCGAHAQAGCSPPPAEVLTPSDLVGKWKGTCRQYYYPLINGTSASAACTKEVTTVKYTATYALKGDELTYVAFYAATNFTVDGQTISIPALLAPPVPIKLSPNGEPNHACLKTKTPPAAFLVRLLSLGKKWEYRESGIVISPNDALVNYCPKSTDPALFCNAKLANYHCTAWKE